jgi:aspartyl-tRNA(Asn)/glutamyl-tRNA(Gln) amidotransferase subunit C|tara:strand:- start:298 stop:594 length:297 start_codon:yes stop_codon:yes gene_type:complete
MALSDQELKEIAYLARINVNEESLSSLKKELEDILDLFEELNNTDTSKVKAMSHPLDLTQPIRKDEVTEENLRDELLKNAPSVKSGLFLVPKVIDGEN